jgi:flagellar protein FliJ
MNRIKRLKPVQDLAAQDERKAAAQLGENVGRVEEAQQRLGELLAWERDYAARMQQGAVNLSELQSYRLFMGKLGEAIEQQRAAVAEAERGVSQARTHWQSKYARHAALSKVVEQCRKDEVAAAERREQRQLDEFNLIRTQPKS